MRLIYVILAIVIVASSCDHYSSPVPAGKLNESYIDTSWLGFWKYNENSNDSSKSKAHFIGVYALNKHEYLIQVIDIDSCIKFNDLPNLFTAQISNINNTWVASITAINADDKKEYLIYPFTISNNNLMLYSLDKSKMDKHFNSSNKLKKYLKDKVTNPAFLNSKTVYKKMDNKSK